MEIHDSRPVDYRWHIMMMMQKYIKVYEVVFIQKVLYLLLLKCLVWKSQ